MVAIPETLLARAKSGDAQVSIWSEPAETMSPSFANSHPRRIQMTRTYLAKFSMPGAGDDVQLGMTATLTLSDHASERVARLPLSALFNQGDGTVGCIVVGRQDRNGHAQAGDREGL